MDEVLITFLAVALVIALALFIYIGVFGKKHSSLDRDYYQRQWAIINRQLDGSQAELHQAVFEADKLLDRALKEKGMRGQTMGDRLKSAKTLFSNNNAVWQAHKMRNRLAHETGVRFTQGEVRGAMTSFKTGLKDLGAL
ncbi:MAG TPA: hypothetical protein VLA77_02945 [Candidatus Saccharimonadales bacterium]|nr:hypothetical protein [Candidatus Saccharimonadales bacterium]